MASTKQLLIGTGLGLSLIACVLLWRTWLAGMDDPALTKDPRAYARATGMLVTPAGVCGAGAFSDGPGRVTVTDALALVDNDLTAATALLGKPDRVLTKNDLTVALWWNAVIPAKPSDTQPPALHLRIDIPAKAGRISRVACLGAMLAEIETAPH